LKKKTLQERLPLYELTEISVCLAVVGGFLDAYTYLFRGGVFANAQTGNMVLLGISIAQANFGRAGYYFIPIFAFFCGILVTELIKRRYSDDNFNHWQHITLILELALLLVIGLLPKQFPDAVADVMVSFVCSLQVNSFNKVRGLPYASTMCTGNLRSAAVQLGRYLFDRQLDGIKSSARYFIVIFAFCCGAAFGTVTTRIVGGKSILICSLILFALLCAMLFDRRKIATAKNDL
jgi:uncharacterized membrane protein YoaK (UPF0700 family)